MDVVESLGKRVARLRNERGWTQERLAERLAVSRVAVSHIEMQLTVPGERTVVLLAGIFGMEPWQLVAHTDYPLAKRERLPAVTSRFTHAEHLQQLFDHDLRWLAAGYVRPGLWDEWHDRIAQALAECQDRHESQLLLEVAERVRDQIPRK